MRRNIIRAGALVLVVLAGTYGIATASPNPAECGGGKDPCLPTPVTQPAPPSPSAAASTATIKVDASLDKYYAPYVSDIAIPRLTVHVTGSNFVPGRKVTVVLVNTSTWKTLARRSVVAQGMQIQTRCPTVHSCSVPNSGAGTIDLRMRLNNPPATSDLQVVYRSAGHAGIRAVALH